MNQNQNNAGAAKNTVSTPAQETQNVADKVMCLTTPKALNWAVGLAALGVGFAVVAMSKARAAGIISMGAYITSKQNQIVFEHVVSSIQRRTW